MFTQPRLILQAICPYVTIAYETTISFFDILSRTKLHLDLDFFACIHPKEQASETF